MYYKFKCRLINILQRHLITNALLEEIIQNNQVHKQSFSIDITRCCRYLNTEKNFLLNNNKEAFMNIKQLNYICNDSMFENDVKKVIDRYDNNMFKNLNILLKYNYDNRNETTLDRIDLNNTFVQNNFTLT